MYEHVMKSIERIMNGPAISAYTGSETTYDMVAGEIRKRWGEGEVEKYDPYTNMLTFATWASLGFRVKKKEKAIRSITFIEKKDENGNVIARIKRTVCLFYYKQVEKVEV